MYVTIDTRIMLLLQPQWLYLAVGTFSDPRKLPWLTSSNLSLPVGLRTRTAGAIISELTS